MNDLTLGNGFNFFDKDASQREEGSYDLSKMSFGKLNNRGFVNCKTKTGSEDLTVKSKKNQVLRAGEYWLGEKLPNGSFLPLKKVTEDFLLKIESVICEFLGDEKALTVYIEGRAPRLKNEEELKKIVEEAFDSGGNLRLKNISPEEVSIILAYRIGALLNTFSQIKIVKKV